MLALLLLWLWMDGGGGVQHDGFQSGCYEWFVKLKVACNASCWL